MLTAAELLLAWERGLPQPPFRRALLLLQAGCPEQSGDVLAKLSIGQRDRHLLDLREALFGPQLPCQTGCPACGELLELNLDIADLRLPAAMPAETGDASYVLETEGFQFRFRLPNSQDLAAADAGMERENVRDLLLERCLAEATNQGKNTSVGQLPEQAKQAIAARMAEIDPQSHLEIALSCPTCSAGWQSVFDIAGFLWSEIQTWATRVLREVHTLASAYGWREADILAMSPLRRKIYLDMVGV